MATPVYYDDWRGSTVYLTDTVYVSPGYAMHMDITAGVGNSYISLVHTQSNSTRYHYYIYGDTKENLQALLPIRVVITANGTSQPYTVAKNATITELYSRCSVPVSSGTSNTIPIPKDGSEFTIETTLTTNYDDDAAKQDFTWTHHACGTIFNKVSFDADSTDTDAKKGKLITGRIYKYELANPVVNTETITPTLRLGFYPSPEKCGEPFPVAVPGSGSYPKYFHPRDHWCELTGAYTEGTVAISCFKQDGAGIKAGPYYSDGYTTYILYVVLTQRYKSSDLGSSILGGGGVIAIGGSILALDSITSRAESDDELQAEFPEEGPCVTEDIRGQWKYSGGTETYRKNGQIIKPLEEYGKLVAGKTYCALRPVVDFKYGDDGIDNDGSGDSVYDCTVEAYLNGATANPITVPVSSIYVRDDDGKHHYEREAQYYIPVGTTHIKFVFTVTGCYWGQSIQCSVEYDAVPYSLPQLTAHELFRCKAGAETDAGAFVFNGTWYVPDEEGDHVKIGWNAIFSELNNHNSPQILIKYGPYTTYTHTFIPETYVTSGYDVIEISPDTSWNIGYTLKDDFSSSSYLGNDCNYRYKIDTRPAVIDFPKNRYALGMGKVIEAGTSKDFSIRADWTLRVYQMLIGNYTSESDQELTDWMRNIEAQLAALGG